MKSMTSDDRSFAKQDRLSLILASLIYIIPIFLFALVFENLFSADDSSQSLDTLLLVFILVTVSIFYHDISTTRSIISSSALGFGLALVVEPAMLIIVDLVLMSFLPVMIIIVLILITNRQSQLYDHLTTEEPLNR